jgi:pyroglutamyl-peptidase
MLNWPSNTSEVLMRSLQEDPPALPDDISRTLNIEYYLFDAVADSLHVQFSSAVDRVSPDVILFTGSCRHAELRLERFALNWLQIAQADAAGMTYDGGVVVDGAPCALSARMGDLESIAQSLRDEGVPCVVSNFAGTSLCNQLLYYGLCESSDSVLCGFLHLPLLPEQVNGIWQEEPSLSLELQRLGVSRIIEELVRECQIK